MRGVEYLVGVDRHKSVIGAGILDGASPVSAAE